MILDPSHNTIITTATIFIFKKIFFNIIIMFEAASKCVDNQDAFKSFCV